jgi:hypothetical protein
VKFWTPEKVEQLRRAALEYPNIPAFEFDRTVGKQLGTSGTAVAAKRSELGIYIEASIKFGPKAHEKLAK